LSDVGAEFSALRAGATAPVEIDGAARRLKKEDPGELARPSGVEDKTVFGPQRKTRLPANLAGRSFAAVNRRWLIPLTAVNHVR
jgi:hypothetical protein